MLLSMYLIVNVKLFARKYIQKPKNFVNLDLSRKCSPPWVSSDKYFHVRVMLVYLIPAYKL